jgi:Family of unknown function (DUF5681)
MPNNPNAAANLRPAWRAGESGNPRGARPDPLLHALRRKMTAKQAQQLMAVLLERALDGDMKAMEMIWDRMAGKPIARQEQGEPGDFSRGFEIRLVRAGDDDGADAPAS